MLSSKAAGFKTTLATGPGRNLCGVLKREVRTVEVRAVNMLYTIVLVTMTLASFVGAWGLFKDALKARP